MQYPIAKPHFFRYDWLTLSEDDMPTEGGEVLCGIVAEWTAQHFDVAIERGVRSIIQR